MNYETGKAYVFGSFGVVVFLHHDTDGWTWFKPDCIPCTARTSEWNAKARRATPKEIKTWTPWLEDATIAKL